MPLPQLERRVMPLMGGADYLGPELNGGTYRMKFIQNGRVIWVDVDPQTGRIIRRSRPVVQAIDFSAAAPSLFRQSNRWREAG